MKNTNVYEISPKQTYFPDVGEAWRNRGLAVMLMQRNLKLRFAQTALGGLWVVIQPLLLTGTLSLVLGGILSLPTDGSPYVIFAFSGTVLWSAFQRVVTESTGSMAGNMNLISKVYFPRVLVPVSGALTVVFDIIPSYVVLVGLIYLYGLAPGWPLVLSPLVLLLAIWFGLSIGLLMTVVDTIYRDVRMLVPAGLQLLFFLTPVMYADRAVPSQWEKLYALNPLVSLLRVFRWSTVAGAPPPSIPALIWCIGCIAAVTLCGMFLFARLERLAVDRS